MPTLRLADLDLHYEDVGEGSPLVLLHGLGSSGLDWEFQVTHFRDRFRVVTPDLRGHGRSSKPPGPYPIPLLAADVGRFLDVLELAPVHVVGLSMGGMVGLQLAADMPEMVRSLVAINTMPEVFVRTLRQRWKLWQHLAVVRFFGMRAWARYLAPRFFPGDEHAELRRVFVERWSAADRRGFLAAFQGFLGWSVADRLGEIEAPTLVVAAEYDYTSVESKREWAARIPRAELVVVPDSRHALPAERPPRSRSTSEGRIRCSKTFAPRSGICTPGSACRTATNDRATRAFLRKGDLAPWEALAGPLGRDHTGAAGSTTARGLGRAGAPHRSQGHRQGAELPHGVATTGQEAAENGHGGIAGSILECRMEVAS